MTLAAAAVTSAMRKPLSSFRDQIYYLDRFKQGIYLYEIAFFDLDQEF